MRVAGPLFSTKSRETVLRTKREAETEDERRKRLNRAAKKEADTEDVLEAMIRRSIKLHGP
jgi:hypothetical protein